MKRRRPRRRIAAMAVAMAFVAGFAVAHTKVTTTVPADGSVLAEPPGVIELNLAGPAAVTWIQLADESGEELELERTTGLSASQQFAAKPPHLPDGVYTVTWRALAADGHVISGAFTFEVRQ